MSFSGKSRKAWQEDRPPYLAAFSHFTPLVRTAALAVPHYHSRSCDYACAQSVIRVTAACVLAHNAETNQTRAECPSYARGCSMDAIYFRDKAETCLRLAKGLSWNNPARGELMELAQEFQRQAKELEATASAERRPAC